MPRVKMDPVDVAFRAWAQLDDKQRDQFEGRVVGYWAAIRRFSLDGATPKAPATPTRKRKQAGTYQRIEDGAALTAEQALERTSGRRPKVEITGAQDVDMMAGLSAALKTERKPKLEGSDTHSTMRGTTVEMCGACRSPLSLCQC